MLNIDAKFRKPNEVAWKSVGKTDELETYSMTYAEEIPIYTNYQMKMKSHPF